MSINVGDIQFAPPMVPWYRATARELDPQEELEKRILVEMACCMSESNGMDMDRMADNCVHRAVALSDAYFRHKERNAKNYCKMGGPTSWKGDRRLQGFDEPVPGR